MADDLRAQTRHALAAAIKALRASRRALGQCIDCGKPVAKEADDRRPDLPKSRCRKHRQAASERVNTRRPRKETRHVDEQHEPATR